MLKPWVPSTGEREGKQAVGVEQHDSLLETLTRMASKCNYLQACRRLNATRAQCQSKLHLSTCWFISCQSQACPASPLNPLVPFGHALRFSHCYWPAFEWQSVIWYSCPGTFLNTSLKVATPPPRLSSYYSIHLCEGEMYAQVASLSLSLFLPLFPFV